MGAVAQGLAELAALPEDMNSVPRTHVWWSATVCNSSSKGYDAFLWPPKANTRVRCVHTCACAHTHTRACTHTYTHRDKERHRRDRNTQRYTYTEIKILLNFLKKESKNSTVRTSFMSTLHKLTSFGRREPQLSKRLYKIRLYAGNRALS